MGEIRQVYGKDYMEGVSENFKKRSRPACPTHCAWASTNIDAPLRDRLVTPNLRV